MVPCVPQDLPICEPCEGHILLSSHCMVQDHDHDLSGYSVKQDPAQYQGFLGIGGL